MKAASHNTMFTCPWQQYRGHVFTEQLFGDLSDVLGTNMLFFALGMLLLLFPLASSINMCIVSAMESCHWPHSCKLPLSLTQCISLGACRFRRALPI